MNTTNLLNSIRAFFNDASIQYVILCDRENNHYDDSWFYFIALDLVNGRVIKHVHSSTTGAGYRDLPNSVMLNNVPDEFHAEVHAIANEASLIQAREYIMANEDYKITVGDTVTVSNPRARKHKGVTFVVAGLDSWIGRYGRVESTHAYDANRDVVTALANLTVVEPSAARVSNTAERILLGLAL